MAESREHNLVVRNTFIDVEDVDDAYEAPERTRSDPTGGKSKDLMRLGRIPDRPMPIPVRVKVDNCGADAGEDSLSEFEPMRISDPLSGNLCGIDEEEEDDDEGEDEGLARTVTQKVHPCPVIASPASTDFTSGLHNQSHTQAQAQAQPKPQPQGHPWPCQGPGPVTMMALNSLLPQGGEARPPLAREVGGPSAVLVPVPVPVPVPISTVSATYADANANAMGLGHGVGAFTPWGHGPGPRFAMTMPSPSSPFPAAMTPFQQGQGQSQRQGQGQRQGQVDTEAEAAEGQEGSFPSDWHPRQAGSAATALATGAPLGRMHSFHQETRDMGQVSPDYRVFTKVGYEGRLSVVSESRVHQDGVHRYLVQFTSGELSRADGVGFVFSSRLPCAKNIQRIVSIFVNQRGRICMRVFADVVRAPACVKPLELGDWVELAIDLDKQVVKFNVWGRTPEGWPPLEGRPDSSADFPYGSELAKLNHDTAGGPGRGKDAQSKPMKLNVGHLACVVKNVGVTITLGS